MDVEQEEMQFLGFFGMIKESNKIIITWRKIFNQITFTLILPLAFIFLAQIEVSTSSSPKSSSPEPSATSASTLSHHQDQDADQRASQIYKNAFDAVAKTFQTSEILGFYSSVSAVIGGSTFSSAMYLGGDSADGNEGRKISYALGGKLQSSVLWLFLELK